MRSYSRIAAAAFALAAAPTLDAQDAPAAGAGGAGARTAELPLKAARNVAFTTDEGTWLSIDISPDGRTIVTDIAGDLYTIPMTGGKATRITNGLPFDAQPRWSPDGKTIAYVTDKDGSDDVWVIDADGRNPKQITRSDRVQWLSPEWTPDGRYIVVSRNSALFSTTYALYLYHKDGGSGIRMTPGAPTAPAAGQGGPPGATPPQRNYVGPAFGKDGR